MRRLAIAIALSAAIGCGRVAESPLAETDAAPGDTSRTGDDVGSPSDAVDSAQDPEDRADAVETWDAPEADAACLAVNECTDGIDNDGDGLVDWLDPECTGPADSFESTFATGFFGSPDPCKTDCAFDGNWGSGNDGCFFPTRCMVGSTEPSCPYDPSAVADPLKCPVPSEKCVSYCTALLPNGCDCAGCCEVFAPDGHSRRVRLADTCSVAALDDETKCPACVKVTGCDRPCGRCDRCIGKSMVPSDCTADQATACAQGRARCDTAAPCPCGEYCVTGCCVRL